MDFVYKFPAVRGIQSRREYFIAMVPLRMLSRLFQDDQDCVSPEFRAQRRLNETRVPVISRYITENPDTYVFSALAASIDGDFSFTPNAQDKSLGLLEVSMDARFLINDGQHRKAAIIDALEENEELKDETIPVVFFGDEGLKRSQQIFTDLNKNAVKTSNSIAELYDSRDEVAVLTRSVINDIEFLNNYTDKERDNLGKYSSKLFTLNTFYVANKTILGRNGMKRDSEQFIHSFWSAVVQNMLPWRELTDQSITKKELREDYIATQGIVIQALGRLGSYYYSGSKKVERDDLKGLQGVNWLRTASCWRNRAIRSNGRIITNKRAALLIGNVLKNAVGIPLDEKEQEAELQFDLTDHESQSE